MQTRHAGRFGVILPASDEFGPAGYCRHADVCSRHYFRFSFLSDERISSSRRNAFLGVIPFFARKDCMNAIFSVS